MICFGYIFLNLIKLRRREVVIAVLLSVDHLLLQSAIELVEGHRSRVGSQSLKNGNGNRRFRNTNL